MRRRLTRLFAHLGILVAVLAAPSAASASSVVFSNFGAGFAYDASVGNAVGDDGFGLTEWVGETFTSGLTVNLSTIEIALSSGFGTATDPLTVALRSSAAGAPGTILESFTVGAGAGGALGTLNPPLVLTSSLFPLLTTGVQYWLTVQAPGTSAYVWNFNNTGANAAHAISVDDGSNWDVFASTFFTPGAFQVDGTAGSSGTDTTPSAVPEPASLILLGSGLLGAVVSRRRHAARQLGSNDEV
jgi:hypothetical protein